jgi:hypothetical protein
MLSNETRCTLQCGKTDKEFRVCSEENKSYAINFRSTDYNRKKFGDIYINKKRSTEDSLARRELELIENQLYHLSRASRDHIADWLYLAAAMVTAIDKELCN